MITIVVGFHSSGGAASGWHIPSFHNIRVSRMIASQKCWPAVEIPRRRRS